MYTNRGAPQFNIKRQDIGEIMELLSAGLGILSFIISIFAIKIAKKSDQMMRAIANLEYDEKLAIMADHSEKIKNDYMKNTSL